VSTRRAIVVPPARRSAARGHVGGQDRGVNLEVRRGGGSGFGV